VNPKKAPPNDNGIDKKNQSANKANNVPKGTALEEF
jgi:hypothetical protein